MLNTDDSCKKPSAKKRSKKKCSPSESVYATLLAGFQHEKAVGDNILLLFSSIKLY